MVGVLDGRRRRHIAAASAGVLVDKSLQLSNEVYAAMLARGFKGEPYTMDDFEMRAHDWWAGGAFAALSAAAFWLGR